MSYTRTILFFSIALILLTKLNQFGLYIDGAYYATFGKYAAENNYWLIPKLSDYLRPEFFDHIPFLYLLEGLFFKLFGATFTTARLFSGLLGALTFISLYFIGGKDRKALYAVVLLLFNLSYLKELRFPNHDILLGLTTLWSLYFCQREKWWAGGLFFGLSLLAKSLLAIFIPLALIPFALKKPKAYLGLMFGFLLFSLWPIALLFYNRIDIFSSWFQHTFIFMAKNSAGTMKNDYLGHLKHLITFAPLTLVAFVYGLKKRPYSVYTRHALIMFLLLSLKSLKYSQYLVPVMVTMTLLAGEVAAYYIKTTWDRPIFSFILFVAVINFFLPAKTSKDEALYARIREVSAKDCEIYIEHKTFDIDVFQGNLSFYSKRSAHFVEHFNPSALSTSNKRPLCYVEREKVNLITSQN